ncbi:MAG: hypothetical protein JWO19_3971 [Bryobacterales bacterium]|nr:hypothetical protein [Bryobacterales bacterium]
MWNSRACTFSTLAAVLAVALPADAQSVISAHSGVIHFFEGAVYLDDQPLEFHLGKYPSVPQGAELRTTEGRAEVLLTPGVFLRLGERSAIRMVANDLADTQVELQTGSAIVDSAEPNSGTSVTLIYKDWRVHFLQKGIYRIDSDPPRLWVRQGEAEVFAGTTGQPVSVEHGMSQRLAGVLVPERSSEQSSDALSVWANGRSESISADNAITAQIDEDPASRTAGLDGFTYFPFLGVPSLGLGSSSPYNAWTTYQPGFNSIYLPGYTYRPLMLGLMGREFRTYPLSPQRRIGVSPGAGTFVPVPRAPVPRAPVPRAPVSAAPVARPAPVHAAPHAGVHGGGRR